MSILSINCRFVFHELSSSKIDNKVIFPLENLDLSEYISGPITNKMFYDLQSCVCHFGGMLLFMICYPNYFQIISFVTF